MYRRTHLRFCFRLLFLPLLLRCVSSRVSHTPLTTPLISCPCTFTVSRPSSDNTPFSIIVLTPTSPLTHVHPLTQHNLTNRQAAYNTFTTAFFSLHIPHTARHAISIQSHTRYFNISHVTHTDCPTLLQPDPPGLFRQNIVGGLSASSDLRDFLAYLHNPITGRACTGTIIAPRWIITAAHCEITQQHIAYVRGDQARQGVPHSIYLVFQHRRFNNVINAQFDITAVQLTTSVSRARFMQVSVNRRIPIPSSAARVLGYGSVSFDSPSEGVLFGQLRQVDVPVVTHAQCAAVYNTVIEDYQVCAGYLGRGGCDSCQGDSGGPLIQYDDNGEPVLVGVVSRGIGCGEVRFPGIYIRVGGFEEWLDSTVDQYWKVNRTRAVLAVTRSSRATFTDVLVPVIAVCGSVLVIGAVILVFVKMRQRKWRQRLKEVEKSGHEDTGSTNDIEGVKQWQGQQVVQNEGVRQSIVVVSGENRPTMEDEQGVRQFARRSGNGERGGNDENEWSGSSVSFERSGDREGT